MRVICRRDPALTQFGGGLKLTERIWEYQRTNILRKPLAPRLPAYHTTGGNIGLCWTHLEGNCGGVETYFLGEWFSVEIQASLAS